MNNLRRHLWMPPFLHKKDLPTFSGQILRFWMTLFVDRFNFLIDHMGVELR